MSRNAVTSSHRVRTEGLPKDGSDFRLRPDDSGPDATRASRCETLVTKGMDFAGEINTNCRSTQKSGGTPVRRGYTKSEYATTLIRRRAVVDPSVTRHRSRCDPGGRATRGDVATGTEMTS